MNGTLTKKINGTWVVRVQSTDQHPSPSVVEHGVEYPLHPEDANLMVFRGQLLNDQHIMDGKEVEFEIAHLSTDPLGRDVKTYAKLVDKLGNEDVQKLGYDEKGKPLTYWGGKQSDVREVVEDDVEKLALEEAKKLHCIGKYERYNDLVVKEAELIKLGIKVAKSTLYTEEQVRKLVEEANYDGQYLHAKSVTSQMMRDNAESYSIQIIQSLKQPKQ
jgi:hypothetical protein